jgi:hypothetical protein
MSISLDTADENTDGPEASKEAEFKDHFMSAFGVLFVGLSTFSF